MMVIQTAEYRRGAFFFAIVGVIIACLMFVGCGGGTTGTGGSSSDQFNGKILSVSGDPIVDAVVTVLETGDSTRSDSSGQFSLETEVIADTATLLVTTLQTEVSVTVDELTTEAVVVEVSLEVDEVQNTATVKDKKVRPKKKPKPSAQPTLEPTAGPSAMPTAEPIQAPSAGPSSLPTVDPSTSATAEPSPTASVVPSAVYRGVVSVSDVALLVGARIGLAGQSGRDTIASDGSFRFTAVPAEGQLLVIKVGDERAVAALEGVTAAAKRVTLGLSLRRGLAGKLRLSLDSVVVKNDLSAAELLN